VSNIVYKEEPYVMDPRLGRFKVLDERSLLRLAAPSPIGDRTYRYWRPGEILDQGNVGACTGFSTVQGLLTGPNRVKLADPTKLAFDTYHLARKRDEWPGESYEGSSVNGAMRAARELGYISGWRNAYDVMTGARYVLADGPVILGIDWYDEMFDPKGAGAFIEPKGSQAGGHAIAWTGVNLKGRCPDGTRGFAELTNSWGRGWGDGGQCRISLNHLGVLMAAQGELAMPIEVPVVGKRVSR
jgi:hypothetical protein